MKQTYAIVGLGRFGSSLLESLIDADQEVLVIDKNPTLVENYMDIATHAVIADAQDEDALRDLDLASFDHVVVAIGHNQQASILTTILLKDIGVRHVIAKAENNLHARVLDKVGADQVVRPENEMAHRLAEQLMTPNLLNFIDLGDKHSLGEIKIGNLRFANKTIEEIDIRKNYGLNIISIRSEDRVVITPEPDEIIQVGDVLTVAGETKDVKHFESLVAKIK
ncbi:TrkA family potassium uptake protein [Weissella paramesenteroides]|uniref:potassium channel family protein n=1 Tax=Weissella paramesenteroides TaxID=1249 RepID=UPI001238E7E5|nr:TrkA family potassium uptake protein [Weissella paramesenteroides]KAA8439933.1 TrkA family potassium uptake protein [Weissella paramesenteroides]KAA8441310.1 TrkA family potassium uptake protein [Weissella paramesenteroides]KAA8444052.1 TrkA family potassium uptake protein [Weissella paramesenteroides]KAA8446048.1 TrkA family potassium uptake protein [Weissella paramesenteroides]KAA8448742.1 TrkA family potassium uptake protein [Weissella paramesenteroides]